MSWAPDSGSDDASLSLKLHSVDSISSTSLDRSHIETHDVIGLLCTSYMKMHITCIRIAFDSWLLAFVPADLAWLLKTLTWDEADAFRIIE